MSVVRRYPDSSWGQVLLEAFFICLAGVAFGVLLHYPLLGEAFLGRRPAVKALAAESRLPEAGSLIPVLLEDVRALVEQGAVLVDARSLEAFREGHIAGARSLPLGSDPEGLARFRDSVPLTVPVVVYCSGYGCRDSHDVGAGLIEAGYKEVLVFEGGFPEWRAAGLPVATGAAP